MPLYESIFIARQDVTPAQVEAITNQMVDLLKTSGGNVLKIEPWGLRKLAYKINKNRKGHYVLLNIDAPASALQEYERNLKINEDILRYMSIKVDVLEEGPSPVLRKAKTEREFEGEAA